MTYLFTQKKAKAIQKKHPTKMGIKLITFISSYNAKLNVHILCGTKLHIVLIKL